MTNANNILRTLRTLTDDARNALIEIVGNMYDETGGEFAAYFGGEMKAADALVDSLGSCDRLVTGDFGDVNGRPMFQVCSSDDFREWMWSFDGYDAVVAAITAAKPAAPKTIELTADINDPTNALTGNSYSGKNISILAEAVVENGFDSNVWCTFRQALELGRCVIEGQKVSAQCVKVVTKRVKNKRTGKVEDKRTVRHFNLFNIAQTKVLTEADKAEHKAKREAAKAVKMAAKMAA